MSSLKPIGSEKLKGDDKIKRIMEIARFNEILPNSVNETSKSEYSITLADSHNYQIIKERQGYVIKRTLSESETDYIEPMKNRKYYSSYSQALKRLNLLAKELNRLNENEDGISLFGEQKKFVLKTPKPAPSEAPAAPAEAPPAVPSPELPPSPLGDEGAPESAPAPEGEYMSDDLGAAPPEGGEEMDMEAPGGEEQVTFKTIQKLTGKLTQKIRTLDNEEGMTSEDVKYVINMVLSSLNLSELTDEDKEDIMSKFEEPEGEEMGPEDEFGPEDDMGAPEGEVDSDVEGQSSEVPMEGEMEEDYGNGAIFDSIFGESKVDSVISKYFEISKKEILENRKRRINKNAQRFLNVEKQLKEVARLSESEEQKLAAQKILEENFTSSFVGKTNKRNLVIESKGKQYKVTPQGLIL
jgi:hypothetical protein